MGLGLPLLLGAVLLGGWAVDSAGGDEVQRGVEVGGEPVGGLRREALAAVVQRVARRVEAGDVRVRTPDGDLRGTATALGVQVDERATVDTALRAGRRGWLPGRVWGWVRGLLGGRSSPVAVDVERDRVGGALADRDPTDRRPATEPGLGWDPERRRLTAVPGADGRGLDTDVVAEALVAAAGTGRPPFQISAEAGRLPPRLPLAAAERLRDEAERRTAAPLPVVAGLARAELAPEAVRPWLRSRARGDRLVLAVDEEDVSAGLPKLLPGAGSPPVDAGLRVEGDGVVVVPDVPGTACCADDAPAAVLAALRSPDRPRPVALGLRPVPAERTADEVAAMGVREPVASFTTSHAVGEARVTNIHRMADLLRGSLIAPGARFSVNRAVGPRTEAKGFVEAGVIADGVFEVSVGGGISQFATTLFNAAFFAGLDFEAYQSHSIYISRYPYGREATLSYPAPDLELSNPTPHGVLLWPTYDGSSITVTLWSTRSVVVDQTGQSSAPAGACTRVTTERTRTTLASGRREVDRVYATYRPGEGVDC